MYLHYVAQASWPPLAWLAECEHGRERIVVHHGSGVEANDGWFAEAVWDGEYGLGGFDRTDVVFGSGGRLRDDSCVFVSSASTVDRLNSMQRGGIALVSNSLACLLTYAGASVDPTYPRYYEDFRSVCEGLKKYRRRVATSRGDADLTYFENLRWDGRILRPQDKPSIKRNLGDFTHYVEFLQASMGAIARNMRDPKRSLRYELLGTLSTGYDSPTVAAIARSAGLREVLCFDRAHDGRNDSGEAIARCLGLTVFVAGDSSWREMERPEIPFLASNAMGEEVRFRSAEALLSGRVLLTGYHGDKVWDLHNTRLGPEIIRGDPSGLSLTEYRLWAKFLHLPLPFLGIRQMREINAISRSAEMRPWDVGGEYTRPICRRIVESAGVPRGLFGTAKKNGSVMLHNYSSFLSPSSQSDYLSWLRANRIEWVRRGKIPPFASVEVDRIVHGIGEGFAAWSQRQPVLWRLAQRVAGMPTRLRRHVFPWAVARAQQRYVSSPDTDARSRSAPGEWRGMQAQTRISNAGG